MTRNLKEYNKEYYLKNKGKIKEYGKEYRKKNKEQIKKQHKQYREKNKEKNNKLLKKYCQKLKNELFNKLGNKCNRCNNQDVRVLSLHHVSGKNEIKSKHSPSRWKKYLNQYDEGVPLELLCANCHCIEHNNMMI